MLVLLPETAPREPLQAPHHHHAARRLLRRPEIHHRIRLQRRNRRFPDRTAGKNSEKR